MCTLYYTKQCSVVVFQNVLTHCLQLEMICLQRKEKAQVDSTGGLFRERERGKRRDKGNERGVVVGEV